VAIRNEMAHEARINNIPLSDALHVVEPFTRTDAETLEYEITYPMRLDNDCEVFENACHEGNYGLPNILSGARAAERSGAR